MIPTKILDNWLVQKIAPIFWSKKENFVPNPSTYGWPGGISRLDGSCGNASRRSDLSQLLGNSIVRTQWLEMLAVCCMGLGRTVRNASLKRCSSQAEAQAAQLRACRFSVCAAAVGKPRMAKNVRIVWLKKMHTGSAAQRPMLHCFKEFEAVTVSVPRLRAW